MRCECGVFGVRRRRRSLDEDGPQPDVAFAGAAAALAARTLVVARRQPRPGGERGGRGEAAHVRADLGDDHRCGGLREAGDGVAPGDDVGFSRVLGARRLNLGRKAGDALLQTLDLCEQLGQHETLVRTPVTPQRLLQLRPLLAQLAQRPFRQLGQDGGIGFASQQGRQDGASRDTPAVSVVSVAPGSGPRQWSPRPAAGGWRLAVGGWRLAPSSAVWTRLTRVARSRTQVVRSRVRSRTSRWGRGGMHRGRTRPCVTSSAIRCASVTSVVRPRTALRCGAVRCGAVRCATRPRRGLRADGRRASGTRRYAPVRAGTRRYAPVRARPTGGQPPSVNQSTSRGRSPVVVPQACVSARRAPGVSRVRRPTTTVRWCASLPAPRSHSPTRSRSTRSRSCSHTPRCVHGAGRRPTPRR